MKKLSYVCLITFAAISFACNAAPVEPSFACKTMLERGSEMFCAKDEVPAMEVLAEAAPTGKGSFACDTMIQRGSEMFCAKEEGDAYELAIAEGMNQGKGSYACDTMIQRGSEMFCAKQEGFAITHVEED
ncbi:hypothetical protein ACFL0R_02715 [Pseudomonadota bacterium]